VFKLDPTTRKETVLYSFTGADGRHPTGGLIFDAKGNLYGTTWAGGTLNWGVAFKVSPKGQETVLSTFEVNGDYGTPYGGLIMDAKGNLYGSAEYGGANGYGVAYKLTP
jgi:uncharacterized repeat protein (TIGR03803 family)